MTCGRFLYMTWKMTQSPGGPATVDSLRSWTNTVRATPARGNRNPGPGAPAGDEQPNLTLRTLSTPGMIQGSN